MYSHLCRSFVYPLWAWKNKFTVIGHLAELEKSQWLREDELREIQFRKLKRLLEHACRNVPFYREEYGRIGFDLGGFGSIEELERLPSISKSTIQNRLGDLIMNGVSPSALIKTFTGGSTGEPTLYYRDPDQMDTMRASSILFDRWTGWDIGLKRMLFWGAPQDLSYTSALKRRIEDRLVHRRAVLCAYDLGEENLESNMKRIESFKPVLIMTYPNAMYIQALYCEERGKSYDFIRGVITSAETLTDQQRSTIERVFGCRVFDRYGCREIGVVGQECEFHDGLHVNSEKVIVEIRRSSELKNLSSNGIGEILVTDLDNYRAPLIRYSLGDLGTLVEGSCGCGRGMRRIGKILGRINDLIRLGKGHYVHASAITQVFRNLDGVRKFQLIQKDLDDFEVRIMKSGGFSDESVDTIKDRLHDLLGQRIGVEVNFVEEISTTVSGKVPYVISNF